MFVSKREFVLAHKGWVVSVITNSSLLPSTRSSTQRWTVSAVDGWAQPTASAFWCPITTLERLAPKAVAAWTARPQATPTAHRLRDRRATKAKTQRHTWAQTTTTCHRQRTTYPVGKTKEAQQMARPSSPNKERRPCKAPRPTSKSATDMSMQSFQNELEPPEKRRRRRQQLPKNTLPNTNPPQGTLPRNLIFKRGAQ